MRTQRFANNHPEQGSILVYFALLLVVLLGFGAIALDGSNAYVQQRRMQNAADAAALAGARMAALGSSNLVIENEINKYATVNGAQEVSWQFTQSGKAVEVQAEETFDTAFAKLFGMNTMTARAVSEAAYGAAASAGNMLPMAASCEQRTYGQTYTLWDKDSGHGDSEDEDSGHCDSEDEDSGHCDSGHCDSGHCDSGDDDSGHCDSGDDDSGHGGSGDEDSGHGGSGHGDSGHGGSGHGDSGGDDSGHCDSGDDDSGHDDMDAPGNFGWLDWDGGSPSTPELADNILHPSNSGYWHIGDSIPGGPGVKSSSQVRSALNTWIDQHVTIPLYDSISGHGNNTTYQICGFAEFVLTGFNFQGSDKWVEGTFIQTIKPDGEAGGDADYGISVLYISK